MRTIKIIATLFSVELILQSTRFYEGLFWAWRMVDYACNIAFLPGELIFGNDFMYFSALNFSLSLILNTLVWAIVVIGAIKYKAGFVENFLKKL